MVPVVFHTVLLLHSRRVPVLSVFLERDSVSGKFTGYNGMFIALSQSPK